MNNSIASRNNKFPLKQNFVQYPVTIIEPLNICEEYKSILTPVSFSSLVGARNFHYYPRWLNGVHHPGVAFQFNPNVRWFNNIHFHECWAIVGQKRRIDGTFIPWQYLKQRNERRIHIYPNIKLWWLGARGCLAFGLMMMFAFQLRESSCHR